MFGQGGYMKGKAEKVWIKGTDDWAKMKGCIDEDTLNTLLGSLERSNAVVSDPLFLLTLIKKISSKTCNSCSNHYNDPKNVATPM